MPRPGPRPYECVRRAWHSERHQPTRGSIIQQIFRVVSESHSTATKKNREYQDKLPVVVLKAEEIMYSKANSEAEYVDLETLWERLNDAINTIIRRDESTETGGELLPPCVEAVLNLGCLPVRASRSQRHNNPRTYLSPRVQESTSAPPQCLERRLTQQCPQLQSANQLRLDRPKDVRSACFVSESNQHLANNYNSATVSSFPLQLDNSSSGGTQSTTMGTNTSLNFGSVYPLYYGTQYQGEGAQQLFSQIPEPTNSNNVLLGVPVGTSIQQPFESGTLHNLFSCGGYENTQADIRGIHEKTTNIECDLSLRLGLLSDTCMSLERHSVHTTKDAAQSSFRGGSNHSDTSAQENEFSFFPERFANAHYESSPS